MRKPSRSSTPYNHLLFALHASLFTVFLFCSVSFAQSIPYLSGRVNDHAGILSDETRMQLEQVLKSHEEATTNQVVVLTIPSLEGAVLEEFSLKVAETWKLGKRGTDNGVLLLVARDDRKLRIEVGYGLEGTLTDAASGSIIRNEIVPRFKEGDFDGGIRQGVEAILGTIEGTYVADEYGGDEMDFPGAALFLGIFLFVVGLFTLIGVSQKGFMSWFMYVFLIPFWFGFPSAVFGVIGGLVAVAIYTLFYVLVKIWFTTTRSGKKAYGTWATAFASTGSSGGGWSSSSGGFSGGGGSFGGGGSSGSW